VSTWGVVERRKRLCASLAEASSPMMQTPESMVKLFIQKILIFQ